MRVSQVCSHNARINVEEILCDAAQSWILVAESCHEYSGLAVVVELEMDAALGQDGALELVQGRAHLRGQAVLEDKSRPDIASLDDGEEFGGAVVDMRGVHAAGVQEPGRHCQAKINEGGKGLAVGEITLAPFPRADATAWVGGDVEVELQVFRTSVLEDGESVDVRGRQLYLADQILVGRRVHPDRLRRRVEGGGRVSCSRASRACGRRVCTGQDGGCDSSRDAEGGIEKIDKHFLWSDDWKRETF